MGACGSLRVARATDFMIKAATAVGAAVAVLLESVPSMR